MSDRNHELRLVSFSSEREGPGIQPYCPCGWVGSAEHSGNHDYVSELFRKHAGEASDAT